MCHHPASLPLSTPVILHLIKWKEPSYPTFNHNQSELYRIPEWYQEGRLGWCLPYLPHPSGQAHPRRKPLETSEAGVAPQGKQMGTRGYRSRCCGSMIDFPPVHIGTLCGRSLLASSTCKPTARFCPNTPASCCSQSEWHTQLLEPGSPQHRGTCWAHTSSILNPRTHSHQHHPIPLDLSQNRFSLTNLQYLGFLTNLDNEKWEAFVQKMWLKTSNTKFIDK